MLTGQNTTFDNISGDREKEPQKGGWVCLAGEEIDRGKNLRLAKSISSFQ
jgi:hypothetical protein